MGCEVELSKRIDRRFDGRECGRWLMWRAGNAEVQSVIRVGSFMMPISRKTQVSGGYYMIVSRGTVIAAQVSEQVHTDEHKTLLYYER